MVTDTFTVTGTSGSLSRDDTADVVVTDFSVSVSPGSQKVPRGSSGSYELTVTRLGGFTGTVSLSVSHDCESGVTGSLSDDSLSGSETTSTLTIVVGASAAVGSCTITVTGTSGSLERTATAELVVVPPPNFSLSISPSSQEVNQGASGRYTVRVTRNETFTGTVELSISGLGSGLDDDFSSASVTFSSTSASFKESMLTIEVGEDADLGPDDFTVTGTSGGLERTATATVDVTDPFSLSISPLSQDVAQGSSGEYRVTVQRLHDFSGTVSLSVSHDCESGVTGSLSDDSLSGSETTSTLTIVVGASAAVGSCTITVTGTSGSLERTATAELVVVPPPNFSLSISPSSQEVNQGSSGRYTVTVERNETFTGTVMLSVSDLGSELTGTFSDSSLSSSQTTSTLTIDVGPEAPLGSDTFTVRGRTSGGLTDTAGAEVVVTDPFSLSISPQSEETTPGNSITYMLTVQRNSGFTGTVALSVRLVPGGGLSYNLLDNSLSSSQTTANLDIRVASVAQPDSHTITATATSGGGVTRTATATLEVVPPPQFYVAVTPPSTREVGRGSSGTYTVRLSRFPGFTDTVELSVSDLGAGVTGSFSDASLSGSESMSTLTISVGSSATVGSDSFTIRGTSGNLTHSVSATVVVTAPEDFTLSVSSSSQEAEQGSSVSYTVTLSPSSGFSSSVALSVSGLGSGITGSFSPTSVSASAPMSTLTISVDTTVAPCSNTFTIRGTSGDLTRTVTATVVVKAPEDFTLLVLPSSQDVEQGSSGSYRVKLKPSGGFSSSVTLSVSGLGSGITGSFSPTSVSSTSRTSTLTLSASSTATTGSDSFTITGTGGSLTRTVSATAVVTDAPDFTLSLSPTNRQVEQGSSGSYTVTLERAAGFTSSVSLSVSSLGTGLTGSFSDASLSGSESSSTLTINVGASTALGNDSFTVTGTSGSLTQTVSATAVVTDAPDFTLSLSPTSRQIGQASSGTYTVRLNPSSGFSSSVALSVSGLGSGITGSFSSTSVSATSRASTLTITASSTATTGSDDFTIAGTSGSVTRTVSATVVVPDFTLSVSPSSQEIGRGSSGRYTVTLNPSGGFSSSVALSISGLGSGITGSFSPTSVSSSSPTSTLTISVGSSATIGSDSFTVSGTGGSLTRTVSATVVVSDPPDFTLSLSPSSQEIGQGSSGRYTVTLNPSGGFSSSVALSVSGLGSGITGSFSSTSVSSSAPTSTLTVSVGSSAATGSDSFTISGTGGGQTLSESATVVVSAPTTAEPDFSLSVSLRSAEVILGSSRTYLVTMNPSGGFSASVSLSVSGLGSGITGSFLPTSVSPSAPTSTLTVNTASTSDGATGAAGGSSPEVGMDEFTVTGTGGGLTRTASVMLEVLAASVEAASSGTFYVTGENATGTTPYGSYSGQNESINLVNRNLNIVLPLFTLRGRNGMDVTVVVQYNSTYQDWIIETSPMSVVRQVVRFW